MLKLILLLCIILFDYVGKLNRIEMLCWSLSFFKRVLFFCKLYFFVIIILENVLGINGFYVF